MTPHELIRSLEQSGVNAGTIVRFDVKAGPEHVRYIDLMSVNTQSTYLPDAVVESAGQPFAYVVRRDRLGDVQHDNRRLQDLVRVLACRSDAKYLCVVTLGAMDIFPVTITRELPAPLVYPSSGKAPGWLDLLSGTVPAAIQRTSGRAQDQWVEGLLFDLLVRATKGIRNSAPQLNVEQTLALVGRALFFRFLVDRDIVSEDDLSQIAPHAESLVDVFRTPASLAHTCEWLDRTFNGDLLSLGPNGAKHVIQLCGDGVDRVCWHITNIQHRSVDGQMELDWSGIRFRHLPVDVLSQVYEDFAHEFVPDLARQTSVHFTPRRLAEVLIDGVFSAVDSTPLHKARVLDPAVGGGVFLVLALRRLVAEHWRYHGTRPGRTKIRKILNSQLCGLDINRDALNVAALSLYLAALELDPKPSPINDLKFDKLIGSVLKSVSAEALGPLPDRDLGSLSCQLRQQLQGSFDIVVGNPPWTGWQNDVAQSLDHCVADLAGQLLRPGEKPTKVVARYGSPDVAFLLAARGWAKPMGAIGFALHARLLFQPSAAKLRSVIFDSMRVTGIMNFSALRQDKWLWPTNDAPFALLVARNVAPEKGQSFHFISPRQEIALERMGQFRIDPTTALPVPLQLVRDKLYAFKALYKGSKLGLDLVDRIFSASSQTVKQILEANGLRFSSGYQIGKPEKRTRNTEEMRELPEATLSMVFEVPDFAAPFDLEKVQWPRASRIYKGPLLLFRESPKLDREVRGALHAAQSTVYRENFVGISFAEKPDLTFLRDLLYVLSYSDLVLYFQLLTSSKFGVERDSALQTEFEEFPLVDLTTAKGCETEITAVAAALRASERCWNRVDDLAAQLYSLSEPDQDLIRDTLAAELPFVEVQNSANAPTTDAHIAHFVDMFNQVVEPYNVDGEARRANSLPALRQHGWVFLQIGSSTTDGELQGKADVLALSNVASSYWASSVRIPQPNGSELHGRLDQRRYWTRTAARQTAIRWLRSYND